MNNNNASATSLFRVYSPLNPKIVAKVFAAGATAALDAAKAQKPALARLGNLKAFPA